MHDDEMTWEYINLLALGLIAESDVIRFDMITMLALKVDNTVTIPLTSPL